MSTVDYIALIFIFSLAILLGYFLHKALQAQKIRDFERKLLETDELKNKLAESQNNYEFLNQEHKKLQVSEDKLRQDFYQLTLAFKDLQDDYQQAKEDLLKKQYDVPPEYPRLEESNKLLAAEIQRLRGKIRNWKSKDFKKANKKLSKELKKTKAQLVKLQEEKRSDSQLKKYETLYNHILHLSAEAKAIFEHNEKITPEIQENTKNIFLNQPEFKKQKIFQEIMQSDSSKTQKQEEKEVFDLDSLSNKTIMDLPGIDTNIYALLIHQGISDFETLSETEIKSLKKWIKKAGLSPKDYPFEFWPIQAKLAHEGKWNIIDEFRLKKEE